MIRPETLYSIIEAFIYTAFINTDDILDCLWLDIETHSKSFWEKLQKIRDKYYDDCFYAEKHWALPDWTLVDLDDYVQEAYEFVVKFIS